MIDVAVVPAAGRGTRLGALTRDVPKPMLEVGGKPVLLRVLDDLAAIGVRRAIVVTGHLGHVIEAGVDRAALRVETVAQQVLDGTARAVLTARRLVGDAPFVVAWGDALCEVAAYRGVVEAFEDADAALAVNRVDDPAAGAAVWVDGGLVTRIVEKPAPGTAQTHWNNSGILALPAAAWDHIAVVQASTRGEYELTDAIASMIDAGWRIRAVPLEGPRIDIGTPETLDRARRVFGGGPSV